MKKILFSILMVVLVAIAIQKKENWCTPETKGVAQVESTHPLQIEVRQPLKVRNPLAERFIRETKEGLDLHDADTVIEGLVGEYGMSPNDTQVSTLLFRTLDFTRNADTSNDQLKEALKSGDLEKITYLKKVIAYNENKYRIYAAYYNMIIKKSGGVEIKLKKEFEYESYYDPTYTEKKDW